MTQVITYQSPDGRTIDITRSQMREMDRKQCWPRNASGEYCVVSYGLHEGSPTYSDQDVYDM